MVRCSSKKPGKDNTQNRSFPLRAKTSWKRILQSLFCKYRETRIILIILEESTALQLGDQGNLKDFYQKKKKRVKLVVNGSALILTQHIPIILTTGLPGSVLHLFNFFSLKPCHISCCALGCLENFIRASHFLLAVSQKTVRIRLCHKSLRASQDSITLSGNAKKK